MKIMFSILTIGVLGSVPSSGFSSDSHGGVHILMPGTCETLDDDCILIEDTGQEQPVWYRNQIFEDPDEDRDIPGQLENLTEWPGQREEFSDYLFR